jgi:hypothetical protein
MSTPNDGKPFGLNQIKFVSMDGISVVPLTDKSRTLEFEEVVVTGEFPGDDGLQAIVTQPTGVKGKIEHGGISLEAYALITGHTLTITGLTPNRVATLEGDSLRFPYFKIYGKSLGDSTDDVHIKILKAKLTSGLKGTFKYGEFMATEIEFMGVKVGGKAWDQVINETAADLPGATASPPAFTLSSVPADAATGVVVTDNIVLTFSNALAPGAEEGIILTSAAGVPVAGARTIDTARKVVTINPTASLSAATDYLVVVPNARDGYGQTLADTVINFTTA